MTYGRQPGDKRSGRFQSVGELAKQITPAQAASEPAGRAPPKPLSPLSAYQKRLLSFLDEAPESSPLYQHSVLCQTCMPYRDPGQGVRLWERRNGYVHLEIQAGRVLDPQSERFVEVGLPFGPKPRLVLYHLNAEALRTRSSTIELEDSLTAFVRRTLGLDSQGRNMRVVKNQLARLAAADFRLGVKSEDRAVTVKSTIIDGLELWTPKDPGQRILWPTMIQFSPRYFESLMKHAVPLNEAAVSRLSASAMGLDIYTWLAQRLHRVPTGRRQLVPWVSLWEQFGAGYARINDFRRVFLRTLNQVQVVYPDARISPTTRGLVLSPSRPPVPRRLLPV